MATNVNQLDSLALAESKLAREQVEYDKLMNQLMALRDESHRVEGELGKRNSATVTVKGEKSSSSTSSVITTTGSSSSSSFVSSMMKNNRSMNYPYNPTVMSTPGTSVPFMKTSPVPERSAPLPPSSSSSSSSSSTVVPPPTPTPPPTTTALFSSSVSNVTNTKKSSGGISSGTGNTSVSTPRNHRSSSSNLSTNNGTLNGTTTNTPSNSHPVRSNSTARSINGAASVARSTARSVSPSRTAVTNTSTVTNSVVYRSSMYRSSSPSKAVKNGVVISNFSRSSRFKEEKMDVPGPGKYSVHSTDFAPVTVPKGTDNDGILGHTWSQYYSNTGAKPTPQQAHADAMAAATARIPPIHNNPRSPDGGNTVSHIGSPGTVDTSISGMGMSSSASTIGGGGGIEAHARQLIAGFHGDVQAALEATLKREKALRKEIITVRENANKARLESSHALSTLTNEIESLKTTVRKREEKNLAMQTKNQACMDVFIRADEALNLLAKAVQESIQIASSVGHRNPALAQLGERMRALESVLQSGMGIMGVTSSTMTNTNSLHGTESTTVPIVTAGYTSYSSLTAAVMAPDATNVGSLGASEKLVNTQNMKNQLLNAIPPPPPPRERPLTGAQARGIAPGVDNAYKTISVSAIASFAKRTAEAVNDPSPNALTKAALGVNTPSDGSSLSVNVNGSNNSSNGSIPIVNGPSGWGGESPPHSKTQTITNAGTVAQRTPSTNNTTNNNTLVVPNRGRDIAALLANFSEDFLQPNVLAFFNTHKAALLSMFSRYAGGTARITRSAALNFAQDYRIVPSALTVEEVTRLVSEVLRTSGRDGPDATLAYPEFIELLGLIAYVAAAGLGANSSTPMLTKLHALFIGCADRGANFNGNETEINMLHACRNALRELIGNSSSSNNNKNTLSPMDRARQSLLRGGER